MGSKSQQQVQVTPSASAAILVVMYIAAFVAAFNENIINVALHDIMAAFSVGATTAQWLGLHDRDVDFYGHHGLPVRPFLDAQAAVFRMRMHGRRRSPVPGRSVV